MPRFERSALCLAAAGLTLFPGPSPARSEETCADRILHGGTIWTMDPNLPRAEAVAIRGDRILAVGDARDVLALSCAHTDQVDLGGRTVIPGFNDNHVHTFATGVFHAAPVLLGLTCEEVADVVRAAALESPPGQMITGNAWDYPTCPDPHKAILDEAAPDHPVFLVQYSGHAAWVNSRMLEQMGIDRDTPDPPGGQIVRDSRGEPTGILRDKAMGDTQFQDYRRHLLSRKQHRAAVARALDLYLRSGITSVQDNTWEPLTAHLLVAYRRQGTLTCRFSIWPYGESPWLRPFMRLIRYDNVWVRPGPIKYFADGAFSTRTAWLSAPYADEPDNMGTPYHDAEALTRLVTRAARRHQRLAIHAIGDQAVHEVLNALEAAQARYPWTRDLRMRIEHVQLVQPEDIGRMKALGVVACVQPFALANPDKDVTLLGPERAARAYPYRTLLEAGVPVSFGSDNPAEVDYRPMLGVYYAVTRQDRTGEQGPLAPAERLTPEEAIRCYTMGSAYAEFMESEKGSITPGKLADLAVLSADPAAVDPAALQDIEVVLTIVGGKMYPVDTPGRQAPVTWNQTVTESRSASR